jgi:DNA polymerase V
MDINTKHTPTIASIFTSYSYDKNTRIPLYGSMVCAGFASPADYFIEEYLNLNELLVKQEEATFFVRVEGRSMVNAGIYPNDILIVDRSLTAKHRNIIIAVIDGEVTVKRLYNYENKVLLQAENTQYKDIPVLGELHIWGVVTSVIHRFT